MSRLDRAAQFSPFQALTGYGAAIHETARLTDHKIQLSNEVKQRIDRQLQYLQERLSEHPQVFITHFVPDPKKEGGAYITTAVVIKRIDSVTRSIILSDRQVILLDDILEVHSEIFPDIGF